MLIILLGLVVSALFALAYFFAVYDEDGRGCFLFLVLATGLTVFSFFVSSGYLFACFALFIAISAIFLFSSKFLGNDSEGKQGAKKKVQAKRKNDETQKEEKPKRKPEYLWVDNEPLEVIDDDYREDVDPKTKRGFR